MKFLDLAGISPNATPEYLAALDVEDATPIAPEHRLTMLKRLKDGAGVRVITGPEGAAFWLPVSIEVRIVVAPDDFEYADRAEGIEWALRAVGVSDRVAKGMVTRYWDAGKEPTPKAALFKKWNEAKALLEAYEQHTDEVGSIVVEAHHIEAITELPEQLALLDKVENVAMDWEWNIDPRYPLYQPEGLSVATGDRTWYMPFWALDLVPPTGYERKVRDKVRETILRTPTVWHNAKADLGSQWPGPPLDAFGAPMHDTLVMAFVAGEHDLALKPLARTLLGRDPMDFPGAMRKLSVDTGRRYGGADSRNTYDLFHLLYQRLQAREQWAVYDEIERPIIPIITDMERFGHPIDPMAAMQFRDELEADEERIRAIFLASDALDISKDADIRELVRRRTGYDPGSVKEAVLAKHEGEWMDLVIRYRKVRHRRRAFLEKHIGKWRAAGEPEDFRLFTSFTQSGDADQHEVRGFKRAPRSGASPRSHQTRAPRTTSGTKNWAGIPTASGATVRRGATSRTSPTKALTAASWKGHRERSQSTSRRKARTSGRGTTSSSKCELLRRALWTRTW
jgi:hypothetical protein